MSDHMNNRRISLLLLAAALAGCATAPTGPSVAVMPGSGKSFAQFSADDRACRAYADQALGPNAQQAGANNVAAGAVAGTALGAVVGALFGGHRGAAAGAGMGLIVGTAEGASAAGGEQQSQQRRYDIAYEQCMYAKGNQLPPATYYHGHRRYGQPVIIYQESPAEAAPAPQPPAPPPPPPPPGTAPPPPPPQ